MHSIPSMFIYNAICVMSDLSENRAGTITSGEDRYMEWKTKERSEGTSFSLLTFVSKLTGSLATAVSAALIPVIGLQQVNQDMVLPEGGELNTRFLLWAIVTIIPAVLNLLSLIPFIFYDLEGEKLDTIHRELAQRRENLTGAAADAE